MASVKLLGASYELRPRETVLNGLLRRGIKVAYSCHVGACQTCVLRAVSGKIPPAAQMGLKDTLKAKGYFLSCICRPQEDLTLQGVGDELRVRASIVALDKLTHDVVRVRLRPKTAFEYEAGQYASIHRADGLARSYSLASLPSEDAIEVHVEKLVNGRMSGWLYDEARVGDEVSLQGPSGDCFYVEGRPEQPLLLAGTGTGLGPLYGVLKAALAAGHTGPIWLFHGASSPEGLYLMDEMRAIAAAHPQVRYRPTALAGEPRAGLAVGPIDKLVVAELPRLVGFRAYFCGAPRAVSSLKKRAYMAGVLMRELHADPFLPSMA
jgi:CDP-4-dehydro-6-deoxyglucose reductase, E3